MSIARLLVWAILALALVGSGVVIMFFPGVSQVRWIVAGMSAFLLAGVFLEFSVRIQKTVIRTPLFLNFYGLICLLVIVSLALNQNALETIIAGKNFFQFLSIPFAMFYFFNEQSAATKFVKFGMAVAIVQPVFSLMQYFMFRGQWFLGDRISGTFGGELGTPGANASLAMVMIISIAFVLALAVKKQITWKNAVILSVYFSIPVALTHAKASVVFLVIMFAVIFLPMFRKNKMHFFGGIVFSGALLAAVFTYYYSTAANYTGEWDRGVAPESVEAYVEKQINFNFGDRPEVGLSRFSAIKFWFEKNSLIDNPATFLLGHGLGSVQEYGRQTGHVIEEGKYHGYGLGITALPRLLWDLGLLGAMCFLLVFVFGFVYAKKIGSSKYATLKEQAFAIALQVSMVIFPVSTAYKLSIINIQPFGAFVMMQLGILALLYRNVRQRERDAYLKTRGKNLLSSEPTIAQLGLQ